MSAKGRPAPRWAGTAICFALVLSACSAKVSLPPEAPADVRRGDRAFHYQDYDGAITAYRRYLNQVDQGEYTARTFYKCAQAEYRAKRYPDALATLDELSKRYPKAHWVQVDGLRGDVQLAMGHPAAALQAWDAAWSSSTTADRPKLRQRILDTAHQLNDVELASAQRSVNNKDVRQLLEQQIGNRQAPPIDEPLFGDEKDDQGAPPEAALSDSPDTLPASDDGASEKPVALSPPPPEEIEHRADVPTAPAVPPPAAAPEEKLHGAAKLGCVLPLSGATRQYGERSLRGVQLAFGSDADRLVVKDSGGDAATAARMLNELAKDPAVVAVIGPLQSDAAQAMMAPAEAAHLPLLLLSPGTEPVGRYVLQASVSRSLPVGALLDYAMQKVRLRRFGVLYPTDAYGKELSETFRDEVGRRGGTVVGVNSYPPGVRNVDVDVATVKQWRDAQNMQAVFVPDSGSAAAEFARSFQMLMPDVTLLGVHGWEEIAGHDGALSGILFADTFYGGSSRPGTRAFVEAFAHSYGQSPGVAEAQAYDAALLVHRALNAGAASREDLLERMRALGPVDGATGVLQLTEHAVARAPFLLQVSEGKLQEIGGNTP